MKKNMAQPHRWTKCVWCPPPNNNIKGRVRFATGKFKEDLDLVCQEKKMPLFDENVAFCNKCRHQCITEAKRLRSNERNVVEAVTDEVNRNNEAGGEVESLNLEEAQQNNGLAERSSEVDSVIEEARGNGLVEESSEMGNMMEEVQQENELVDKTTEMGIADAYVDIGRDQVRAPPPTTLETNKANRKRPCNTDEDWIESEEAARMHVEASYSQAGSECTPAKRLGPGSKLYFSEVSTVPYTEAICVICMLHKKSNPAYTPTSTQRLVVPQSVRNDMWIKEEVYLPKGIRTCGLHFADGCFDDESKNLLCQYQTEGVWLDSETVLHLINALRTTQKKPPVDLTSDLADSEYTMLFGLNRSDFEALLGTISHELRDTFHRTARTALGIFLCKMRLGVSQTVLGYMFGTTQRKVSSIIKRVSFLLEKNFVPRHLGLPHLSRQEIVDSHGSDFMKKLYAVLPSNIIVFLDGTYLYVEKSGDHQLQRDLYSQHKHRPLLKLMMIVLPDGYILEAAGMFKANSHNNDSRILNCLLGDHSFRSFFQPGDVFVLDRGFRDSEKELHELGIIVKMPGLLKRGQTQFEEAEANDTRKVTMTRWIVEAANGRLKNVFKFLDSIIQAQYYNSSCETKLGRYAKICCAIINAYYPPLFTDTLEHERILNHIERHEDRSTSLRDDILQDERKTSLWTPVSAADLDGFPTLTDIDLFEVSLGVYQLNNARKYVNEHLHRDRNFTVHLHKQKTGILKAKLESRFKSNQSHTVFLEFNQTGLLRYFCKCKVGSRSLGCCSHVASVAWYMGQGRFLNIKPVSRGSGILDAARRAEAETVNEDDVSTDCDSIPSIDWENLSQLSQGPEQLANPEPSTSGYAFGDQQQIDLE